MDPRRLALAVLVTILLLGLIHAGLYRTVLPRKVASHFGAGGKADGWTSRENLILIHSGTLVFLALLFTSIAFAVPKLPDRWVNLPRKDYWLAPQRREATYGRFTASFLWFGSVTLTFFIAVMHLVFQANLNGRNQLGAWFWAFLIAYLLYTLAWVVTFLLSFSRPPRE